MRFLWCAIGAGSGIFAALYFAGPSVSPFLLASLGGSTIFLFGLTTFPAAQPRALIGGHLIAAFVGIASFQGPLGICLGASSGDVPDVWDKDHPSPRWC